MFLALTVVCVAALCVPIAILVKRTRDQQEMERHSTTAEELHSLITSNREVLLFDVRQPLDLLAYPEIISGARRIPPDEVLENPALIPRDKDTVIYCTCPSEKTSRIVLRRALDLQFVRIKFLKGGLAAWKANGYPVERYEEVFHLYAPRAVRSAG
jgi:rhodanese-related sulfurtransferase